MSQHAWCNCDLRASLDLAAEPRQGTRAVEQAPVEQAGEPRLAWAELIGHPGPPGLGGADDARAMKCKRGGARCSLATSGLDPPLWASGTTGFTPRRPRLVQ